MCVVPLCVNVWARVWMRACLCGYVFVGAFVLVLVRVCVCGCVWVRKFVCGCVYMCACVGECLCV